MSKLAANLLYSKEHEWVEVLEGNLVRNDCKGERGTEGTFK